MSHKLNLEVFLTVWRGDGDSTHRCVKCGKAVPRRAAGEHCPADPPPDPNDTGGEQAGP